MFSGLSGRMLVRSFQLGGDDSGDSPTVVRPAQFSTVESSAPSARLIRCVQHRQIRLGLAFDYVVRMTRSDLVHVRQRAG